MLFDVAVPLRAVGPVVIALVLDEHSIGRVGELCESDDLTAGGDDDNVERRLGKTSAYQPEAQVRLGRRGASDPNVR